MPTLTALVITKVLLSQCNIMAAFVHSHSSLLSDVSPGLPTYNNHNVTQFTVYTVRSIPADTQTLLYKVSKCQRKRIHCNILVPHRKVHTEVILQLNCTYSNYTQTQCQSRSTFTVQIHTAQSAT
jgi:hypothetical protein